jgi:polar amino acid transport system substrate-binding protein
VLIKRGLYSSHFHHHGDAVIRHTLGGLLLVMSCLGRAVAAGPDCSRPFTLALHDHGLLYSADTDTGIDRDFAEELIRRSGCKISVSVMSRARIWQLIESGALDFSLSGIANAERNRFASFAWYFSNKYYLLVRKDAACTSWPISSAATSFNWA